MTPAASIATMFDAERTAVMRGVSIAMTFANRDAITVTTFAIIAGITEAIAAYTAAGTTDAATRTDDVQITIRSVTTTETDVCIEDTKAFFDIS